MKRILSAIIAAICLLTFTASLFACAEKETEQSSGDVKSDLSHLNGLDFGGIDINFMVASADGDDYHMRSIYIDDYGDDTSNSVDVEVFNRNERIKEMLNVNIEVIAEQDGKIVNWGKSLLLAGSDEYDVIAGLQYGDVQLALEGVMVDLNTLKDYNADYIKWNEEYWATSYIDAMSFGNKNYWLTGDLCLRFTGGYYSFFVNTRLYQEKLFNKYGSIYDIVNNKQWTYDTLLDMIALSFEDVDGDDKITYGTDVLGLALPIHDNTNGMAIGAGVIYTRYDENNKPQNNFTNTNKTLISYIGKLYETSTANGVHNFDSDYGTAMSTFAAGNAVFIAGRLNQAELYLSEMTDDYYVIPCPLLSSEQDNYYSSVHDAINIYGINLHSNNYAAAAATLEAMAYESYYKVRPVYYDSFLKFKYTRDDQAAQMIDLMHDSLYTDFVYIWQFSGDLNSMGNFFRSSATSNRATSLLKSYQTVWSTALDGILQSIEEME